MRFFFKALRGEKGELQSLAGVAPRHRSAEMGRKWEISGEACVILLEV